MRPPHRLAPAPRRCDIGTSCASQMFLVYPQMCVAGLRLPQPPGSHRGVGLGPGPSKGGGTFLWAVEFVSCFAEPLNLVLREAQVPPLMGPQFPHQWNPREPPGATWGKGDEQGCPGNGPSCQLQTCNTDGGNGIKGVQARV